MDKENVEAETTIFEQPDQVVRKAVRDTILRFLEGHTVVIWGSGATMPLGFPSMAKLLEILKKDPDFCELPGTRAMGLEERLSRFFEQKGPAEREVLQDRVCNIIGEEFTKRENDPIDDGKESYYDAMYGLYAFLRNKSNVDILTTNYDCSWERLFSKKGIEFIDDFHGNELDYSAFFGGEACSVRLVKVHGSDNWFQQASTPDVIKAKIGTVIDDGGGRKPYKIIIPANLKYEGVITDTTFTNLKFAFDRLIKEAGSYLTIGFGFNDLHLTPLLKHEAQNGKPVVRLMKNKTLGGDAFAEGIPNIITISDAGNDDIPDSSEIIFDVFQKAFKGEFDKARQRLLHFKYLPDKVKDIACFEHFAKELENKNFDNAIEAVRQWKEQVESGKVMMTSVSRQERGESDILHVYGDNLWSLPSFVKLLGE